jgi:hypothetical protein
MVNMKKNALVSKIKEIAVCLEATEMVMLVMLPETILPPNKIGQMNLFTARHCKLKCGERKNIHCHMHLFDRDAGI